MFVKECSVVACASFLCFCVGLCAAQESSVKEPVLQNPIETVQQKEVLIKVTAGNREFRVALNSTPEAKLFYSQCRFPSLWAVSADESSTGACPER